MNILITGVTSGFGKQIAIDLVKAGHQVIGTGRRQSKLNELKDELGDGFTPLCFDVCDTQGARQALHSVNLSDIDVLINNAGLALGLSSADKADFADWQTMINTNIMGLTLVTHEVLPFMTAKNDGYIINIGSTAGNYPYFGANVYGATKAFVKQFSLNLRADLIGKKVRVTNIEPGLCGDTEFSQVRFKGDTNKVSQTYADINYITPQDISNMVLWLINQPKHININRLEVMPTAQTFAGLSVTKNL